MHLLWYKTIQHNSELSSPGFPLTYFINGGGEGGGPSDFFGSETLAKSGFFGSMKDVGIFWGHKKNTGILFAWVLHFSSAQISNNISVIYCWCVIFLGMLKM